MLQVFLKGSRVLCLSEGREKKEITMDELKENKFLHDLNKLKTLPCKKVIQVS